MRVPASVICAVVAFSSLSASAIAAQECRWVHAKGEAAPEDVTAEEARQLAIRGARPRACVALPVGSRDAYFVLTGELNKPSFVAGEEARLTMRCGRECYVTIFNLAANDRFSILFPNSYESVVALRSREEFAFPRPGLA